MYVLCQVGNKVWQSKCIPAKTVITFWNLHIVKLHICKILIQSPEILVITIGKWIWVNRQINRTKKGPIITFFEWINEIFSYTSWKTSRQWWLLNNFLTWRHDPSYVLAEISEEFLRTHSNNDTNFFKSAVHKFHTTLHLNPHKTVVTAIYQN